MEFCFKKTKSQSVYFFFFTQGSPPHIHPELFSGKSARQLASLLHNFCVFWGNREFLQTLASLWRELLCFCEPMLKIHDSRKYIPYVLHQALVDQQVRFHSN